MSLQSPLEAAINGSDVCLLRQQTEQHSGPRAAAESLSDAETGEHGNCSTLRGMSGQIKKDEDVFMAWITFGLAGESPAGTLLWEQKLKRTYKKDWGVKKVIARSFKQVKPRKLL